MIEVDTGSSTVFRFDKVVHPHICQYVSDYIINLKSKQDFNNALMPWEQDNSLTFSGILDIPDPLIKKALMQYNYLMCEVARRKYGVHVVPEYIDVVLWKPGAHHPQHWDDAAVTRTEQIQNDDGSITTKYFHEKPNDPLRRRMFTSVFYLNEEYEGGETFVNTENDTRYLSIPKTGSVVMFRSDFLNRHGVNKVVSGNRVAMSSWFGLDVPESSHQIFKQQIDRILNS